MGKNELWIQEAIGRPGRVRRYLMRVYGSKAFDSKGRIKPKYLDMAERRAEKSGNQSLAAAIRLAKRLKKMARKKSKRKGRKRSRRKRSTRRKRSRRKRKRRKRR